MADNPLAKMVSATKTFDEQMKDAKTTNPVVEESQNEVVEDAPVKISFTSHPILNYRVGRMYKFERGMIHFDSEEAAAKFEANVANLPEIERRKIKKLDVSAAEKISRKVQANQGGATKQTDSTVGDRATQPKLGKTDLADPAANGGAV